MSILNDFILTDSTTREDLIARVNDLDEEIACLETKTEDMQCEIDGLSLTPQMLNRLIEAADVMSFLVTFITLRTPRHPGQQVNSLAMRPVNDEEILLDLDRRSRGYGNGARLARAWGVEPAHLSDIKSRVSATQTKKLRLVSAGSYAGSGSRNMAPVGRR